MLLDAAGTCTSACVSNIQEADLQVAVITDDSTCSHHERYACPIYLSYMPERGHVPILVTRPLLAPVSSNCTPAWDQSVSRATLRLGGLPAVSQEAFDGATVVVLSQSDWWLCTYAYVHMCLGRKIIHNLCMGKSLR
jgi:hypothetical protein